MQLLGRVDVSMGYMNAFDVFALPSKFEGLGIVLIEAQCTGVPCVASTAVPQSACISNIFRFVPLSVNAWVDALLNLLYFGGFIAINLAVMNLLPIPALDGGRIAGVLITSLVEAVTHKKIDPKYEGYIHAAGMILLLALMAFILFKDIFVIFKG